MAHGTHVLGMVAGLSSLRGKMSFSNLSFSFEFALSQISVISPKCHLYACVFVYLL